MASMSPTNTAALADGIVLSGALLSFSKSAAQVGPDILKPPTKTASLKSLETIKSDLENAFKDRGGVDTGGPCVAKTKRFRLRNRDLVSLLLNDFRCAIDSINSLEIHLGVENPDLSVKADGLEVVGTWARKLKTDESDDDDDETTTTSSTTTTCGTTTTSEPTIENETTAKSDPTSQRTTYISNTSSSVSRTSASMTPTITTSGPTPQQTTAISKTSRSASKTSASSTATISSGQSSNATCYTGSEYLFPASATLLPPRTTKA